MKYRSEDITPHSADIRATVDIAGRDGSQRTERAKKSRDEWKQSQKSLQSINDSQKRRMDDGPLLNRG
uniref:Uncharacterized protein n=1 Tax=Globodera rostochiensis TaxID=31243 RepID=A0A914GUC2_GLORO